MVLFSGFIQPKALISDGWIWFYWMNPMAWALKAVTISEYSASKYDFAFCNGGNCLPGRYGDIILTQYGNPTDERYIWYSFAVLIAEYLFLFVLTCLALKYFRVEPVPPPPVREEPITVDVSVTKGTGNINGFQVIPVKDIEEGSVPENETHTQLPFEKVSIAFKDIWYTVTLPSRVDVDLLKGVDGYVEPGTMTALMGSSGAGKTTLLDVLAGRKNTGKTCQFDLFDKFVMLILFFCTGVVKGQIYLNGVPKADRYFRKIMAYVEQFDSLPPRSTAREAIAFSAALRLSSDIPTEDKNKWVDSILNILDLVPLENELVSWFFY